MAERTEQATPRRREESRRRGQVARSPEVASAAALLAGVLALRYLGPWMLRGYYALFTSALSQPIPAEVSPEHLFLRVSGPALAALNLLLPLMGCCLLASAAASLLQTGFIGSAAPLAPDFNRINPVQGLQRLFSLRGLAELVKTLLKCGLLAGVTYRFLRVRLPEIATLSGPGGVTSLAVIARAAWELLLWMALAGAFIAAVDYLFQRRIFEQSIRMTKQDLKEEMRRSEGDPLIKSRLRRLQLQLARGRMMQQVAKATVVVTNPTHLAVALRYHPREHPAPRVVAKGRRLVAERIKEEALRHRVPVVENQPLARALYDTTDLGRPIPVDLYQAVAEIIAFVLRLTGRVPGGVR